MNGNELIKLLKRIEKDHGVVVRFEKKRGRGSHGTLYFGKRFTVLKDRRKEIGPGLLNAMLKSLGLKRNDIE